MLAPSLAAPGAWAGAAALLRHRSALGRALADSLRPFSSSGSMGAPDQKSPGPVAAVSEDLTERVKDKGLLKMEGFIGGDWVKASDGATYTVRGGRL